MSQQLKEKLIFIAAITVAILIVIAAGITGYIAITDPSSREGIGATVGFIPVIALIAYSIRKSKKTDHYENKFAKTFKQHCY